VVGIAKKTFELYTLKNGLWQLDCVFNSKQDATNEAWRQLDGGHFDGIRVEQEIYDANTNSAIVTTLLKRLKGDEKKSASRRSESRNHHAAHTRVKSSKGKKSSTRKGSGAGHLGLMVISVCLILLVFVGLAFVLIDKF
jgi:hypothetical protein